MAKYTYQSAEVESEFNLDREDILFYLEPVLQNAAHPIHVADRLVGRYEIKGGVIRAWPERLNEGHQASKLEQRCPEIVEVPFPKGLDGFLRDLAASPERKIQREPVTLTGEESATILGLRTLIFGRKIEGFVYINATDINPIRKGWQISGWESSTLAAELRAGLFGRLHEKIDPETWEDEDGMGCCAIRVSRWIPEGFVYVSPTVDPMLNQGIKKVSAGKGAPAGLSKVELGPRPHIDSARLYRIAPLLRSELHEQLRLTLQLILGHQPLFQIDVRVEELDRAHVMGRIAATA